MKSTRAIIMLLLSVLAGIAAVLLAARWMGQQAAGSQTRVLVATRDLELGQAITPVMLQDIAWPTGTLPNGSFSDPKKLEGRVVRSSIFKGEPILLPKLAPEGTKAGLDSVIKDGRRAITVKVNEVVGVAGFLAPGSFVDLLVNIKEDRENSISKVVLERIMVLAVAQESNRADETKPKVVNAVTLEVTPEQAEKIDLARNIGTLSLMLRNQVDMKDSATVGVRRNDLLLAKDDKASASTQVAAAPAPVKKAAPVRRAAPRSVASSDQAGGRVEVIRGVQKSISDF
ncbi:Flp pilus assembly protein CpaB [Polaromonas sp.]|uniref:Flp pilus assembly protein CpaB n=1 Tax=Polaromonas sp. TaxID=1869339 RepID=UPI002FC75C42